MTVGRIVALLLLLQFLWPVLNGKNVSEYLIINIKTLIEIF